nr:mannan-binding lectin serine protease 2-like [Dromaius novaehollandiae]
MPKKQFGSFCGKTLPAKIGTRSRVVNTTSITDISGARTGWKMQYTAPALPCPDPEAPPHGRIAPVQARDVLSSPCTLSCYLKYREPANRREG